MAREGDLNKPKSTLVDTLTPSLGSMLGLSTTRRMRSTSSLLRRSSRRTSVTTTCTSPTTPSHIRPSSTTSTSTDSSGYQIKFDHPNDGNDSLDYQTLTKDEDVVDAPAEEHPPDDELLQRPPHLPEPVRRCRPIRYLRTENFQNVISTSPTESCNFERNQQHESQNPTCPEGLFRIGSS